MNVLIIGQCTLHWGRMEFGNIGNFYIMEPFMRELHRIFPDAIIKTTMQMSDRFCVDENISTLPMDLYYGWTGNDLELAKKELKIAKHYSVTGHLQSTTQYIEAVLDSDLVIDFSGDIWGDNANFLGDDRLMVGLLKDRIAQLLGKKVVMIAGSPGPFTDTESFELAKDVYKNFHLVTNREPISINLLEKDGFDVSKTKSLACPAFLFEPEQGAEVERVFLEEGLNEDNKLTVGFILCGWNFEEGPFDKESRNDSDYIKFVKAIEFMSEELGLRICLMSHSNGFDVPPKPFKFKHGRDYVDVKRLERILRDRNICSDFFVLDDIYDPWRTKAIIKNFDMLVSGRIHAAVAALSQSVPTVIIDYGHEPKAHKLKGFATVAGVLNYVADPSSLDNLIEKISSCYSNLETYKSNLEKQLPHIHSLARSNFDLLKDVMRS